MDYCDHYLLARLDRSYLSSFVFTLKQMPTLYEIDSRTALNYVIFSYENGNRTVLNYVIVSYKINRRTTHDYVK